MKNWTKLALTGSSASEMIDITGTSSGSGTTIHTAGASEIDEVYVWLANNTTAEMEVGIEWEGTTDITQNVPSKDGAILIIPGWPLSDSKDLKIFSALYL